MYYCTSVYLYRYLLPGQHKPNYPRLLTAVANDQGAAILHTSDCESYTYADLTSRAQKSPRRWVDPV